MIRKFFIGLSVFCNLVVAIAVIQTMYSKLNRVEVKDPYLGARRALIEKLSKEHGLNEDQRHDLNRWLYGIEDGFDLPEVVLTKEFRDEYRNELKKLSFSKRD